MSEYRHTIAKGEPTGFSQDPDQTVSNAEAPLLDKSLTAKNAIGIGIGAMYGKKIGNAGFQAIVGQFGNSRLEQGIEIGTKVLTYVGIGIASGPTAPVTVALAVATDAAISGINNMVANHANNLDNERLVEDRGTMMQLGAGGYYG